MPQTTNFYQKLNINYQFWRLLYIEQFSSVITMLKILVKLVGQAVVLTTLTTSLTACAILWPSQNSKPSLAPPENVSVALLSSEPLIDLPKQDIVYAQNALNKLGYEVGSADGIWGPRSAKAIRKFEQTNNLDSARGHLSELNLHTLGKRTKLTRGSKATSNYHPFSARVDANAALEGAPQLVIIERTRALLAKPNPYSEVLSKLSSGTGVYVIGLQEGWYEVESEGQIRGYLKAN